MRIAITLLTCERAPFTRRTLETLAEHNDLWHANLILLHGDDASKDADNRLLANSHGFKTVVQTRKRVGVAKMTADLFLAAKAAGADLVLNLQNDWECGRPIPVDDIAEIFADPEVYCLRLYGHLKSRKGGRCGQEHAGRKPRVRVDWQPYWIPGYEIGDIHWGHPPAVTRITEAINLTKNAARESHSRLKSGRMTDKTVRVIDNVFWHIGSERTPGFVS